VGRKEEERLYYSISEVSRLVGVKPHVLRYWETEFPGLAPPKNRAGNRSYRQRDVKMLLAIRELLYTQGYTIAGARKKLAGGRKDLLAQAEIPFTAGKRREDLRRLREGLREALRILEE
jgi:DNA-binding transcriptional MerR regulator